MKILHIHNKYRYRSGEDVVFDAITALLKKKGEFVVKFTRSSQNIKTPLDKIYASMQGIYSFSTAQAFKSIVENELPDVVHVHNIYPLISPSIMPVCLKHNLPVIMRCPNYRLICPIGELFSKEEICNRCTKGREYWCVIKNCRHNIFTSSSYAIRSMVARKLRFFQNNVTLFVPPSKFVKRCLIEAGYKEDRIEVLPNMVSIPIVAADPRRGNYIAYSGGFMPKKGIDTLISATRQTRLPLKLAGDFSRLPELTKNTPSNIEFVGFLNKKKINYFYRNARFLVTPSKSYEPFGLVIAEAMANGLPVIASRIGGIPEVVDDEITGFLFEPGNIKELIIKIQLLWNNPSLCLKMGMAGREKAIREFSEDVYYKRLMKIYKKAIELSIPN